MCGVVVVKAQRKTCDEVVETKDGPANVRRGMEDDLNNDLNIVEGL